MIALRWDKSSKQMVPFGPRNLVQDSGGAR
jgi:hypothetical protein